MDVIVSIVRQVYESAHVVSTSVCTQARDQNSEVPETRMIGVKRQTPKPPKSAKKKKLLKETKPMPDPDDQLLVTPEMMRQTTSQLASNVERPELPPYEQVVMEEGDVPLAEEMVKNLPLPPLEFPESLPHLMGFRYKLLLKHAKPEDLVPGNPPSLTWLEAKFGHLVEKSFWYDRTVKLASVYHDMVEKGDVFDLTRADLEEAVGRFVPFTPVEHEYRALFQLYKKSKGQMDGEPSLAFLRQRFPRQSKQPDPTKEKEVTVNTEALKQPSDPGEPRYVDTCPIHEQTDMRCLNPNEEYGALFFKCSVPGCAVFYTTDTAADVCHQITQAIHPTVHERLLHADLKCHCDYTPNMKLSRSEKNFGRVYLTCFKKNGPCSYFQWLHWKVRPPQGPMDAFVQPRADRDPFVQTPPRPSTGYVRYRVGASNYPLTPEGAWGGQTTSNPPSRPKDQWGRPLTTQSNRPWGPWWEEKEKTAKRLQQSIRHGGLTPSPHYRGEDFRRGVYRPDKQEEGDGPGSVLFANTVDSGHF